MKIRQCPRCQQQMLISTGAFWTCYACSYAITGHALSVDLGHPPEGARKGKGITIAITALPSMKGVPIMERSPHHMRDEFRVIISLALSVGSIIVTIVGWWLLRT